MSLVELSRGFATDKQTAHGYLEVYDLLLGHPERLLEIGVHEGESLRLWRAAWPDCAVVGVDSYSPVADRDIPGATVLVGDAYTPEMLERLLGLFDVIIDDGPHTLDSMRFVAAHYSGLLASAGILVIEDIPDPAWIPQIAAALPPHLLRSSFAVDRRHLPGVAPDSLLFVVTAGNPAHRPSAPQKGLGRRVEPNPPDTGF